MPQYGMTVSPAIFTDEDGVEHIDYDNAYVDDRSGRMAAIQQHNHEESGYFHQLSNGETHHDYGRLDPEVYERFEDDYEEQANIHDYFDEVEITAEDRQYVRESVGGDELYYSAVQWAADNLSPEDIDKYDRAMTCGDVEIITKYATALVNMYRNSVDAYGEQSDYYEEEDSYEEDEEDNTDYELQAAAYNYVGGQDRYVELISWAADNMSEQFIDQYDAVMNEGNPYEVQQAIDNLISFYNQYN